MLTLQNTKWFVVSLSRLAMYDDFIVVLDSEKDLLRVFINRNAVGSVRGMKRPVRAGVPSRISREDRERIECVVVDGINVAGFRINVQATVEFDFRVVAGNDALR